MSEQHGCCLLIAPPNCPTASSTAAVAETAPLFLALRLAENTLIQLEPSREDRERSWGARRLPPSWSSGSPWPCHPAQP